MTDDPHLSHVLIVENYTEAATIRRRSPEFAGSSWVILAACDRPTETTRKLAGRLVDRVVVTDYARMEGRHLAATLELVRSRRLTAGHVERYEP